MKMTLLEIVQDILSDIDGDEVNSIDDTVESGQVAQIVKSTYMSIMSNRDWPHMRQLIQVTPSGSSSLPTIMYLQDEITKVATVNYDMAKAADGSRRMIREVKYLQPDDFLRRCNTRNNTVANCIDMQDPVSGVLFTIRNDTGPTFFTSFDDKTLVFDSYDAGVDDTLQQHKVQVYAYTVPSWTHTDTAIPNLPDNAFAFLLEEAKSRAALRLRQEADNKAEQESERQRRWLARNDKRVARGIKFPNYGRRTCGIKYDRDPTFRRDNQ